MARGLFRTLAAWMAPCSVKAKGRYLMFWPRPVFKVANCDLERSASSGVSWNMAQGAATIVADLIDPSLREQRFVRHGLSWYRYEKESILVINVQLASYAPWAYINLGVYYYRFGDEDRPDIVECHVSTRLNGVLSQADALREISLLDLTNDIPTEVRRDELQTMIRVHGVPFLERLASFEAARIVLSQNPKLAHIAPAVRAELTLPSGSPIK
jgi:hypothetical protein